MLGDNLLQLAKEIILEGRVPENINPNFIGLIPKTDILNYFDEFHLISLHTMLYKIVSKVIALRLKPILSSIISDEKFGFLQDRHIHEVVGTTKEASHTTKSKNRSAFVIKFDLSMIQVYLGGHPPFPLNQHFEPMVLIKHDIHPFDGECNVIPSSFVSCRHHVMIS
jgi:hypothetical protein